MNPKSIDTLCAALWEMMKQGPHDFAGEQREFYLPRLRRGMMAAAALFPAQFADAVARIEKTGDGDDQ